MQYIQPTNDILDFSSKLQRQFRREIFDPSDSAHCASLKTFANTGNWGEVQFFVEAPYHDVPTTALMKFARSKLNAGG